MITSFALIWEAIQLQGHLYHHTMSEIIIFHNHRDSVACAIGPSVNSKYFSFDFVKLLLNFKQQRFLEIQSTRA